MKSTDFLKKLTTEDKVIYSYCALSNLIEFLNLAYDETEYFEMINGITSDLDKYLSNLTLILRDLGIKCQDVQFMTNYDIKNKDYLNDISLNLNTFFHSLHCTLDSLQFCMNNPADNRNLEIL